MTGRVLLEVCVDEAAGLEAAILGGADRIELCSALALGGLTPSPGLIRLAAASPVPVYAMIRPRAGGFVADSGTLDAMGGDIAAVRAAGLAGVVLGVGRPDGRLDAEALAALLTQAAGLGATLHRAFDLVPDPLAALDVAVELGFERILTSGAAASAPDGAILLARLQDAAAGRIGIMAGAGLRPDLVGGLVLSTGIRQVHASCSEPSASDPCASDPGASDASASALGFAAAGPRATSQSIVRAMRQALDHLPLA